MAIKIWAQGEEPSEPNFPEFKRALMDASYHNAGSGEGSSAKACVRRAAEIAEDSGWPYWAVERMFTEMRPLVAFDQFMTAWLNVLRDRANNA